MSTSRWIAHDLRRLFLGIARAAAASSSLVACAAEHGLSDDERPGDGPSTQEPRHDAGSSRGDAGATLDWESVSCASGWAQPSAALNTPSKIDYLGVYSDHELLGNAPRPTGPDGGVVSGRGYTERARVGAPCSGISDAAPCEQQLIALRNGGPACASTDCRFALVGAVPSYSRIDLRDALLERLGSIDTVAEAVLLAAFDGHHICPGIRSDPRDIGLEVRAGAGGGYELRVTWEECSAGLFQELFSISSSGAVTNASKTMLAPSRCAVGRRAPGLCEAAPEDGAQNPDAAAFLAQSAQLEAGSIYAFHQLIRELSAHGAPEALRLAALDALLDEIVHAQDVGALARAFGADVIAPQVEATPLRSLLELALDNVHEGCVRETFGALLATYQAETAEDPRVRALLKRIAEDETRHAALSWQLMAWLAPQLSDAEREAVHTEQDRARARLASEAEHGLSEAARRTLGMPTPDVWHALLGQMDGALAEVAQSALLREMPSA